MMHLERFYDEVRKEFVETELLKEISQKVNMTIDVMLGDFTNGMSKKQCDEIQEYFIYAISEYCEEAYEYGFQAGVDFLFSMITKKINYHVPQKAE